MNIFRPVQGTGASGFKKGGVFRGNIISNIAATIAIKSTNQEKKFRQVGQ